MDLKTDPTVVDMDACQDEMTASCLPQESETAKSEQASIEEEVFEVQRPIKYTMQVQIGKWEKSLEFLVPHKVNWDWISMGREPDDVDFRILWFLVNSQDFVLQESQKKKSDSEELFRNPKLQMYFIFALAESLEVSGASLLRAGTKLEGIMISEAISRSSNLKSKLITLCRLGFQSNVDACRRWVTQKRPFTEAKIEKFFDGTTCESHNLPMET